jgi:3-deoxy-7-phosphoheptulonate synthase
MCPRHFLYRSGLYPLAQGPIYVNPAALDAVVDHLAQQPGLVSMRAIQVLQESLASIHQQTAGFLLQVGDCAERFSMPDRYLDHTGHLFESLTRRLKSCTHMPVVLIGRIAGQYAKSRTAPFETMNGEQVPSFYGDIVNGMAKSERDPDPNRIQQAYECASAVLSDLPKHLGSMHWEQEIFSGHEAYLLPYEEALIRHTKTESYGSSAHFLWIGDRTRRAHHAHVVLAKELANPIGLKVGPTASPEELLEIVQFLNPRRIPGRLTLIIRLGASGFLDRFFPILQSLKNEPILWICDPMHGNTEVLPNRKKTRRLSKIYHEIEQFQAILRQEHQYPAGLHLEASGYAHLTECLDDTHLHGVEEESLPFYESACDPRLNLDQAIRVVDWWGTCWDRGSITRAQSMG